MAIGCMCGMGIFTRIMLRMPEIKAVEVRAEIRQIKTMADGTINIVMNLPEDCKEQVKVMLDWLGYEVVALLQRGATY